MTTQIKDPEINEGFQRHICKKCASKYFYFDERLSEACVHLICVKCGDGVEKSWLQIVEVT